MSSTDDTLLLFGDHTGDILQSLRDASRFTSRSSPMAVFLSAAMERLGRMIADSTLGEHVQYLDKTSLLDMALAWNEDMLSAGTGAGAGSTAIATSLLCISQFAELITYLEANPRALESSSTHQVVLAGTCTGLLIAAAVACCSNLIEILSVAEETVGLAFNLGLEAEKRSSYLESASSTSTSGVCYTWATLLNNAHVDAVQDALGSLPVLSHAKLYVSTMGKSSTTISGPPSAMAKVFSRGGVLEHCDRTVLPIAAAFHAKQLDPIPWNRLVGRTSRTLLERRVEHRTILSSHSGTEIPGETFGDLLKKAYDDILQLPVSHEAIIQGARNYLLNGASYVHLGPESAINITKALRTLIPEGHAHSEIAAFEASPRADPRDIAIIGMGLRLPGSETLDEFWATLGEGSDHHQVIPADRFDVSTHSDPKGRKRNTTLTPYGAFVKHPGHFDRHLFKMSPREARQTDPQQRLLLLATYEALEMAGYSSESGSAGAGGAYAGPRVGSFVGQASDDWREVNASQDIDTYYVPGTMRAFGPGKLHHHFGWEGPSCSLDTACSSSAMAIQLAASSLLSRDCDMAVSGGVNFLSGPGLFAGLSRGGFLSPTGGCKTFDDAADGYCRADGVGVVVLKRLSDALDDRDPILAVLRGAMTNHSVGAISITHPHAESQEKLFRGLLARVNLEPGDIDYVEMHGTGTQAGDAIEMSSVINALSNGCRTQANPLYVGSVKPNVGHSEAASGVTALIKAVLMLQKNTIPPHVGIKGHINRKLPNLDKFNTHISFGKTPLRPRSAGNNRPRNVLVNNFDAAGGNTSILIQDPPSFVVEGTDPRPCHVVTISGKTFKSVLGNCQRLLDHVERHPDITQLENLAYTTTARRMQHKAYRSAYVASSVSGLRRSLEKTVDMAKENPEVLPRNTSTSPPFVIFAFTGQGCAYTSMGAELFKTYQPFRESIERMAEICVSHGFPSFLPLIGEGEGTASILSLSEATPVQVHTAILAIELAVVELWKHVGVAPDAVIGHSLGELAALCTAGVISVATCLYLCGRRAQLLEECCMPGEHAMLAVRASATEVEEYLLNVATSEGLGEDRWELACINSPTSTVVSGPAHNIKVFQKHVQSLGVKTCLLDVPYAFHSSQVDVVLDDYVAECRSASFAPARVPIASTVSGKLITKGGVVDATYLRRQTRGRVHFSAAVNTLRSHDALVGGRRCVWIEVGPHSTSLEAIRSTVAQLGGGKSDLYLPSMRRGEDDWKVWSHSMAAAYEAGIDIDWRRFHRPFEKALRPIVLPSYAFDLDNFWISYKGDWCLTKGQSGVNHDNAGITGTNGIPKRRPPLPGLYKIQTQSFDAGKAAITFAIDISDARLEDVLSGHVVNGNKLCSSSLYAEVAFTTARYIRAVARSNTDGAGSGSCMDVHGMDVFEPLIVQKDNSTTHTLLSTASLEKGADVVHIQFTSQQGDSKKDHARCMVSFGDGGAWRKEWQQRTSIIQERINHLIATSNDGPTHRILRGMVYKLFGSLVEYSEHYQGMQKVYLDSKAREAAADVRFATSVEGAGNLFTYHPCWIDTLAHLSGFVMNGSDATPADTVYISHGWESLRIASEALSATEQYHTYVRMEDDPRAVGVAQGDVYVLGGDDGEVVALVQGIRFRRIKRFQLDHFLPRPGRTVAALGAHGSVQTHAGDGGVDKTDRARGRETFAQTIITAERLPETPHAQLNGRKPSTMPMDVVLSIIAEEAGVTLEDLPDHELLADLGIDSLLSLSIAARVKEMLGWEVPSSVFYSSVAVADLRINLEMYGGSGIDEPKTLSSVTEEKENGSSDDLVAPLRLLFSSSRMNTVTARTRLLFLFPDGGGRASSYAGLSAALDPASCNIDAIYGLDSPLLDKTTAADEGISLSEVVDAFIRAIKRVQPHGPYHLGGWSVGGVFAFEAAARLRDVKTLFLIDPPCPKLLRDARLGFEAARELPRIVGMVVRGRETSTGAEWERMQAHFALSLRMLERYKPVPLHAQGMKITLLWARNGVLETLGEEAIEGEGEGGRDEASNWILQKRSSYGANGWDLLIRDTHIGCVVVDGDHFTMVRDPAVREVGRVLGEHSMYCT